MDSMKVLILSQYYYPEPVEKVHDLAKGLKARGHGVAVLTGFPCYPLGRTYSGYKQSMIRREVVDGIEIVRVPQFPDHSDSPLRRAMYYVSFAASASIIGSLCAFRPEVLWVYQAALPTGLAACALALRFRIPFVLDVVDLWPESVISSGMWNSRVGMRVLRRLAARIYHRARAIQTVTTGFKSCISALGIDKSKITVIENWVPDVDFPQRIEQPVPKTVREFVVLYAGNVGPSQGLETLIRAAKLLESEPQIRIQIVGDGLDAARLRDLAAALGLKNVEFRGRVDPTQMPSIYAQADVLVVHLKPDMLTRVTIPSKTFSYMAAGRPVIMAVDGCAADFVAQWQFGLSIPANDPKALANAIITMMQMPYSEREAMGARGRKAYVQNFSSAVQVRKVERLLAAAVGYHEISGGVG